MNLVRLIPVILSFVLLGAHFLRSWNLVLVVLCVAAPFFLFLRRRWVPRAMQALLVLGAAEWVRTLWGFAAFRRAHGEPWTRMALILGAVALFTLLSVLVFRSKGLRERYGLDRP
jgi:hypothetical protein